MKTLKKDLSLVSVFSIATGAMISSGIFVLPSIAYNIAGNGIFFAYLIAGFLMIPAIFASIELMTALPKAGGNFFYISRILGSHVGLLVGFANWFSIALKSAFALMGIGAFLLLLFPSVEMYQIKLAIAFITLFFMAINLYGAKESGLSQVILVFFLLIIMVLFVFIAWRYIRFDLLFSGKIPSFKQILSVAGLVFISYGGITKIASVSEEVHDPVKVLFKGAFLSFGVVQSLYLLIIIALLGLLPPEIFLTSLTPVSDAALYLMPEYPMVGEIFFILTAVAAMFAFITTANAGILTASRIPLAMARENILSPKIAKLSKRGTPIYAILFTGFFILLVILLLDIKSLAKVASLFMLLLFVVDNFALLVIRFAKLTNYKPSIKAPFFPYMQIFGIIAYLFLMFQLGWIPNVIGFSFIAIVLIFYIKYSQNEVENKSALIHLIENIILPEEELSQNPRDLEEELLGILVEREEIKTDDFDEMIKDRAIFLDLEESITRAVFFTKISQILEENFQIDAKFAKKAFEERENQASTLIQDNVAIPHILIKDTKEDFFHIIIVRAKNGIKWSQNKNIKLAFVLVGSENKRHFHLKSLMAIAQILQSKNFLEKFLKNETVNDMRSQILLIKRNREHL